MDDDSSSFDMNALLRGEQPADGEQEGEPAEPASIAGKSDGGAGQDRGQPQPRDMNAWLRSAVHESRGGPA